MAARTVFQASSLTESTVASTTYANKTSLTITSPPAGSRWLVLWSCNLGASSGSAASLVRLHDGTTELGLVQWRPKDAITDYVGKSGIYLWDAGGSPPGSKTFNLEFARASGTITVKIKNARIIAFNLDAADQYAESEGDSTKTTTTAADKASLTFTPASQGDYLIITSSEIYPNTGVTFEQRLHLLVDGSEILQWHQATPSQPFLYQSALVAARVNLTAASHTIKTQYNANTTSSHGIRRSRILAIRLDALPGYVYEENFTDTATTSSTYADYETTGAITPAAGEHIWIISGAMRHSSTSTSAKQRATDGTTVFGEMVREPEVTTTQYPFAVAFYVDEPGTSKTYSLQHAVTGGTGTQDWATIVGLQLESSLVEYIAPTPSGGVSFSGAATTRREKVFTAPAPSGALTLGGAATSRIERVFTAPAPAGAITFSGAALIERIATILPAGGLSLGGAAVVAAERNRIGAGGISFAGAAAVAVEKVAPVPSGAILFGGAAAVDRIFTAAPSGGVIFSGAALSAFMSGGYAASGGILFAGTAEVAREIAILASGGINLTGAAAIAAEVAFLPSAGIVLGGAGEALFDVRYHPTGGVVFAGSAAVEAGVSYDVEGQGGISFLGTAGIETEIEPIILPAPLIFGGSALVAAERVRIGAGGISFAGAALVLKERAFLPAEGGISFSGEAVTLIAAVGYEPSGGLVLGGTTGVYEFHQEHLIAPPWRFSAVAAEARLAIMLAENRLAVVSIEDRGAEMEAEDRFAEVPAEPSRSAEVAPENRSAVVVPENRDAVVIAEDRTETVEQG